MTFKATATGVMTARNDARAAGGAPVSMIAISHLRYASEAPPILGLQVRKSDDSEGLTELEASIRAHGVIVPLVFKETADGKMFVTAGNRRLKLLRKIYGEIDVHAPCVDSDHFKGDPREIAMATNVSLPPHPVDRYEVIASLVKEGMTPADAQLRFGMSQRHLAQVMRLGSLSQEIRDHYRSGHIDGKTAQAFTLSDDPKEQDRIYALIAKRAYQGRVTYADVTSAILPANNRDVGKFVAFVGVEACRKAKILKQEDLFATNHTVTDVKALKKMVDRKLSDKCDELCKAGWKWAFQEDHVPGNKWSYTLLGADPKLGKATPAEEQMLKQLAAEEDRNEEADEYNHDLDVELEDKRELIEQEIRCRGFTAEQRAKAGCFVSVARDGSLSIEYGRVKPDDAKKVAASERTKPAKKKAAKPGQAAVLTSALAGRMTANLEKAAASVLMREPHIAVASIIAGCASGGATLNVRVGGESQQKPADFASVFAAAIKSSPAELLMMLAQIAGKALSIVSYNPEGMPLNDKGDAALLNALPPAKLNKAIREAFDAEDYFKSVSIAAIVDAVRTAMGEDHARLVSKHGKADAAKYALTHVPKTGWLPKHLRTAHYDGPVEAAAKEKAPAKKKPVAKKTLKR